MDFSDQLRQVAARGISLASDLWRETGVPVRTILTWHRDESDDPGRISYSSTTSNDLDHHDARHAVSALASDPETAGIRDEIRTALGSEEVPPDLYGGPIEKALLSEFLVRVLTLRFGNSQLSETEAADTAADELRAFLVAEDVEWRIIQPFPELATDDEAVELGDGLRVVPFTDDTKQAYWDSHSEFASWRPAGFAIAFNESTHALELRVRRPRFGFPNAAPEQARMDLACVALRLVGAKGAAPLVTLAVCDPGLAPYAERFAMAGTLYAAERTRRAEPFHLTGAFAGAARDWIARYSTADPAAAYELALRRANDADSRRQAEDRLLDVWIGLEALFLHKKDGRSELKYKASMRIGRFLGDTPSERRELRDLAGESYNGRSKVVHGDALNSPELANTMASSTEDLLRAALLRWPFDADHWEHLRSLDDEMVGGT